MFSVRRRSSENTKKPRSPSLRRIGVIRRRSREREAAALAASLQQPLGGRRSRSPGPRRSPRSPGSQSTKTPPAAKPALTPLNLDRPLVLMKGGSRLQRGQPNSTTSGLEKPSPVVAVAVGADGRARPRIKMSFNSKQQRPAPVAVLSYSGRGPSNDGGRNIEGESGTSSTRQRSRPASAGTTPTNNSSKSISHSDSIASLRYAKLSSFKQVYYFLGIINFLNEVFFLSRSIN
jgi:hypothetical protein